MSEPNPSRDAVAQEIAVREKELETLREALKVLDSKRESHVHIMAGQQGQLAISNIFVPPNGHGAVSITAVQEADKDESPRHGTARILALFDRRGSKSLEEVATAAGVPTRRIAIGVLMKHGYLRKKGHGYVRTAKAYTP